MAVFGFDDVANHANMLLDDRRVRAFADAIAEVVRPGDVVADIGAGTGLLAIIAAKRGARRVYAVERGPLASLIAQAAHENGVAEVVEVIRSDARDVTFAEPPSVIVSETLGSFGIDEDILGLLQSIKSKARADCRFIPASFEIEMSLASLPALDAELATIAGGLPVTLTNVRAALASRVTVAHVDPAQLLGNSASAGTLRVGVDGLPRLLSCTTTPVPLGHDTAKHVSANAIVAWFRAELSPTVSLRSGPGPQSPSWAQIVFPIDPSLPLAAGTLATVEVRPRLATDRGTWAWSASCGGETRRGDAMSSLVGDKKSDWLDQLGIRTASSGQARAEPALARWSAALSGGPASVDVMAQRLRSAFPTRYGNDDDAVQDVLRLVLAAERSV
jgi:precorrin-6B methylase 2